MSSAVARPGRRIRALGAGVAAALLCLVAAAPARAALHAVVIAGLGGESDYERRFTSEAESVARALEGAVGEAGRVILLAGPDATADNLRERLAALREQVAQSDALALVLIGHGSYDGERYKFNLRGPDVSAEQLARWLDAVPGRQLIVNTSSASGASLEPLAREGRWLITATRSGRERNATQFGRYWAEALVSDQADLDKDGWISARESFDFAERAVSDFYEREVSLATEHPRLEGDRDPPFRLGRLGTAREAELPEDPELAAMIRRRDRLESEILELRDRREEMGEERYRRAIEDRLLELATLEEQLEARRAGAADDDAR